MTNEQAWRVVQVAFRGAAELQELLDGDEFVPKAYARNLALRHYGLTSVDTLKKDRQKISKARKAGLDISPTDGATIQTIVADLVGTPDDIVAKAKLAMEPKDLTERQR